MRRGAGRLLLAGVGVWLTCDAPLHLAQLNGRHAGACWLAGCWLAAGCPACVTEYRIDAGLRQQNLSFYEGGQQNDEGGQNRYNYASTYCTGTDVRGCKQLYAAVPVYSCT